MDEQNTGYRLQAPGAETTSTSYRFPSVEESFPQVDDHLVEPEGAREEIVGGEKMSALPANDPHSERQSWVATVVSTHTADGYRPTTELLTRHDHDSDFASDAAVLKKGVDPVTGRRHLEEVAFEVVAAQRLSNIRQKAPRMMSRGVRRVFAIFLKSGTVGEWSSEKNDFVTLDPDAFIEDPCFDPPIKVSALLDEEQARASVYDPRHREVQAIRSRGKAEGKVEGKAEGMAASILRVLDRRGLDVDQESAERIGACEDSETLGRWLDKALVVASVERLFGD